MPMVLHHAGAQLSAEWLSKGQRRAAAQQLGSLWRGQGLGGPICFSWIDWLQNDVLSFLGITERLLLTFTPHDPAPSQSSHERPTAEAPRLPPPAQRMDLDVRAPAHEKAAADVEQVERQAGQQLAGPAKAPQAGSSNLQSSRMNGASRQAPDRQQTQHQHFQDNGSLIEQQAPWRYHLGRQTADDCAAERSSNGQLGMRKNVNRSQSNHGASPQSTCACLAASRVCRPAHGQSQQAASKQGQGPRRLQEEQSQQGAAVLAGKQLMQNLQPERSLSQQQALQSWDRQPQQQAWQRQTNLCQPAAI